MRKLIAAALVSAAVALVAGTAVAAGPSVTITSPTAGQRISAHRNPYIAVAGAASFAAPAGQTTRFYLRRNGCGTSNDDPHLSVTSGSDAGDGCGLVLTSVVGAGGTVDQGASVDYPSSDGMPLTLDASRTVTGTIDLESFGITDPVAAGAGVVTVSVDMEALYQGNGVQIGSDSQSVLVTPTQTSYPVTFAIQPNGALDRADLSGIDLRVHVEGPYAFSGYIGNSGKSWVDVPSWSASFAQSVQVSLDDPSFTNPVPARLDGTSWSVAIPTPALGSHTVYARATQGFGTGAAASQSFTVTK
ncbi:MAG TPA: hypothetical protein VFA05_07455 [Gaiellaceae bacterium]|nr:hypothetical protein [Gaiellaceae bacterium]